MKNINGITLIALIITIIILLILTGVTMNIAVNGGLFNNAQRAVEDTNTKVGAVQDRVDELRGVLDEVASQKDEHNWYRTGDNLTCSHCGINLVIGDYLGYVPDVTSQTVTVTSEEAGDKDDYTGVSSTSDKTATVTTTEIKETISNPQLIQVEAEKITMPTIQTFTQETGHYWKVLGIEDSDGNGTNETLLIKMASPTETPLFLAGTDGYNNGIDILNKICKELYSSSRYGEARSIKIEDINNCFQYSPAGGMYDDGSTIHELNGFNTQIKDLSTWDTVKLNGTYTPDGTNTEEKLGSYKADGYHYVIASPYYITNPATAAKTYISNNTAFTICLDVNNNMASYWLASKGTYCYEYIDFGLGYVEEADIYSCSYMCSADGTATIQQQGICPVVSLKNEIPPKIEGPEIENE